MRTFGGLKKRCPPRPRGRQVSSLAEPEELIRLRKERTNPGKACIVMSATNPACMAAVKLQDGGIPPAFDA